MGPGEPGSEEVRGRAGVGRVAARDVPQSRCPDPSSLGLWREVLPPTMPQQLHGAGEDSGETTAHESAKSIHPSSLASVGHGWEGASGQAPGDSELFAQDGGQCNSSCPRDQAKPKANISSQHLQAELETYFMP